jgi:pimeloyl-ACP methyl ester carboxylesterase
LPRARRVVLIHGAATTSRVWRHVVPLLDGFDVRCPDRPGSGDLAAEVAALAGDCRGALVAGVSGGATLGLALAAAGVRMAAAVLHEPAVGSLRPGLLDGVRAAYQAGGTTAFAEALYGTAWSPGEAPADAGAVARDLAMFGAFEPAAPVPGTGPVVITVGECSPPARHESVRLLAGRFGLPVWTLPGAGHAVHLEHPGVFAAAIRRLAATMSSRSPEGGGQAGQHGVAARGREQGDAMGPPG